MRSEGSWSSRRAINADGLLEDPTPPASRAIWPHAGAGEPTPHAAAQRRSLAKRSRRVRRRECCRLAADPEDVAALDRLDRGERSYWDNSDVP